MAFVWQISVLVLSSKTIIKGVVLKGAHPPENKRTSVLENLIKLIKSYARVPLKTAKIKIKLDKNEFQVLTNKQGIFKLELDYTFEKEPEIDISFQNKKLNIVQEYPVFFNNLTNKIDVISDIDDTILVSHTNNIIKRIGVLSFVTPLKRKTVEFTRQLLNFSQEYPCNVFYVSKSESNLFHVLYSFINNNQLPKAILLLSPYLNFKQLLKGKKGKDFKLNNIQYIIENSNDKKFILFGDDTQRDMEIYAIIAKSYPKRIARIYIRKTKKNANNRKRMLLKNLKEIFPATIYFNESTDIDLEMKQIENLILTKNDLK
jgi:phosphatidate phosphatase APP1